MGWKLELHKRNPYSLKLMLLSVFYHINKKETKEATKSTQIIDDRSRSSMKERTEVSL